MIVDDVNLPLSASGSARAEAANGHNGLKSIIERLGSPEFHRMRMGVGDDRKAAELVGHVLATFHPTNGMRQRDADRRRRGAGLGRGRHRPGHEYHNGTADGN